MDSVPPAPPAPPAPRRHRRLLAGLTVVAGAAVVSVAATLALPGGSSQRADTAARPVTGAAAGLAALQAQLRRQPVDYDSWAVLGFEYVQQARITGDPTYYPKAEGALKRSLSLHATDNIDADTGMAALSAARHDFSGALTWADRALTADPESAAALAAQVDAYTELARYDDALTAARRLDRLEPSVASFTRLSYAWELRGKIPEARRLLALALGAATTPSDVAYARFYLGELAWNTGDLIGAFQQYQAGLEADPSYLPLRDGLAKVEAARGDTAAALRDYTTVVGALPLPLYVSELTDLYLSLHRTGDAAQQEQLLHAEVQLLRANGVNADLELALFEADHGDPASAVKLAQAEWKRRHSVIVADALSWALHSAGRDREALGAAEQAARLGTQDARYLYHRGMIEVSLHMAAAARRDLTAALKLNPAFSPTQAPLARTALARLGAA